MGNIDKYVKLTILLPDPKHIRSRKENVAMRSTKDFLLVVGGFLLGFILGDTIVKEVVRVLFG
ncbi:hypothetical protein COU77_01560 [Candidatus Peregrinibacteria bacterium CG10_big_fil_rev_8_21_14_0_10_49_16]|nr:MAG: hypothetical protein COU77_01560 [Candidatus Peregrinibacteria bacterium CG10_big_fil_rev_8_21_14_0_10_49_16]